HYVTLRKAPNDADFSQQWSLNGTSAGDAQAQTAWNVHTGGVNSLGEDVVVAIVDDGIDVTHDDLKNNIWVNTQEIPDNGIDDDNNGYIDDIYGWNAYSNN